MKADGDVLADKTRQGNSRVQILWSHARPHLPALSLGLVLGVVSSTLGLASPLATRWVLDAVEAGSSLATPVWTLVALLIIGAGVSWSQQILLGTLAEGIVYHARTGLIRRYLRAKVLPLLRQPSGDLVTRVTSDSMLRRDAASSSVIGLINAAIMLVGSLALMAFLDLFLALISLLAVALIVAVFAALMPAIGTAQGRSQAALGSLGGALAGTLRAIKTIKVARAEQRQERDLFTRADEARGFSIRAVRREALIWTIAGTGIQATILLMLALGAWRVSDGTMTISTLVAFLLYAFGLLGPITAVSQHLSTLQSGLAAAGRIREIEGLEQDEPVDEQAPEPLFDLNAPALTLRSVRARYQNSGYLVLRDIDLDVPRRGHIAIVGPSGAGKTTIFSLILGFIEPERGELRLGGIPYSQLSASDIRAQLAYVEQETPVIPGTFRDNLLFANPAASPQQVAVVLHALRLGDMIDVQPEGLDTVLNEAMISGGQRQRIALARALLAEPRILLLDEATAQVDGLTEAAIHRVILEHSAKGAVITIAHRLSTVIDADQILVMDNGRIVARGTHTQLLGTSALYRNLVEALRIMGSVPTKAVRR